MAPSCCCGSRTVLASVRSTSLRPLSPCPSLFQRTNRHRLIVPAWVEVGCSLGMTEAGIVTSLRPLAPLLSLTQETENKETPSDCSILPVLAQIGRNWPDSEKIGLSDSLRSNVLDSTRLLSRVKSALVRIALRASCVCTSGLAGVRMWAVSSPLGMFGQKYEKSGRNVQIVR